MLLNRLPAATGNTHLYQQEGNVIDSIWCGLASFLAMLASCLKGEWEHLGDSRWTHLNIYWMDCYGILEIHEMSSLLSSPDSRIIGIANVFSAVYKKNA